MEAQQSLTINIGVNDKDNASKVFSAITESAGGLAKTMEELKGRFGRGSAVFEAAHLFGGAGPILGLTLASRELSEFANKMGEISKLQAEGKLSAEEARVKYVESLPVIGGMAKGFNEIFAAASGIPGEIEEIKRSAEVANAVIDANATSMRRFHEEAVKVSEEIRKQHELQNVIGLGPYAGFAQKTNDINNLRDQLKAVKDDAVQSSAYPESLKKTIESIRQDRTFKTAQEQLGADIRKSDAEQMRQHQLHQDLDGDDVDDRHEKSAKAAELQSRALNATLANLERQNEESVKKARDDFIGVTEEQLKTHHLQQTEDRSQFFRAQILQTREADGRLADTVAEAQIARLRNNKQFYEADLAAMQKSFDDKQRVLREGLQKQFEEVDKQRRAGIFGPFQALGVKGSAALQALGQDRANADVMSAGQKAAGESEDERKRAVRRAIDDAVAQGFASLAKGGNRQAQIAAESYGINRTFADRKSQLEEILKSASATDNDKANARALLATLDSQKSLELSSISRQAAPISPFANATENRGGLSGISERAQLDTEMQKSGDEQTSLLKSSVDQLKEIVKLLGDQAQPKPKKSIFGAR